jgi:hypothetical protein
VYLDIGDAAGRRCRLKAGESYRVNPSTLLTTELEMLLGSGRVQFYTHANGNGRGGS